jgi:hypothetical protein
MHRKILASVFAAAMLVAMAVPLFGGGGTALAEHKTFDIVDMNDRFATQTFPGSGGFAKVEVAQEGSIEVSRLHAKKLAPDHLYEVLVTIQLADPGDFSGDVDIVSSGPITSNANGHLKIKNLDLGSFDPDTYRVDIFVTHTHATVAGSGPTGAFLSSLLDRDPLLACQPFPVVTVE